MKAFLFGLVLGIILQGIGTPTEQQYDARLSSSFIQPAKQTILLTAKTRTTLSERVHRRMLLRSAQRLGIRMFVVADNAPLHMAAPKIVSSPISFPAFDHTVFPVIRIPNWGAMHTPSQWDRSYSQMNASDFISVPAYDLSTLTIPLASLQNTFSADAQAAITAKLFYSTRYFAAYDIDADEYTGLHSGIDLKLAPGTPIGAIAGGMVRYAKDDSALGLHVMIEHRLQNGGKYFSIYAHFDSASVQAGDIVTPGQIIGTVGMTGNTTGPHLHLQVDRDDGETMHTPYEPMTVPTRAEIDKHSINPITFITEYATSNQ